MARERRAEAECRRERWALSQMAVGRARGARGMDGQGLSGLGSSAPSGNGRKSHEDGWDLLGLDQLARLMGAPGRYDAGLGGAGADVVRLKGRRPGDAEALMSVVVEKEEACKVRF